MLKYAVICALLALAAARPEELVPEMVPEVIPEPVLMPMPVMTPEPLPVMIPMMPQPVVIAEDAGDLDSEASLLSKSISFGVGIGPSSYYGGGYPYSYGHGHGHGHSNYYQQQPYYNYGGYGSHHVQPSFYFHKHG